MFSRFPWRFVLVGFFVLAVAIIVPLEFIGNSGNSAAIQALAPSAAPGVSTAASPTTASVPATVTAKKKKTAAATSAAASKSAAVPASAGSVAVPGRWGFAAPELLGEPASMQVEELEGMKAMGVTSVRLDADWNEGQPTANSYYWLPLDTAMASIKKVGLAADLIIDGCPAWAAVPAAAGDQFAQPASAAQFGDWAGAVAKRYDGDGADYFEIWNEENISEFWQPAPDPAAYTADLKAAYSAIKAVDPSGIVITGGLAGGGNSATVVNQRDFLQDIYTDGGGGYFDAVADHPYTYPETPENDPTSAWAEMSETSPSLRSIMTANGDSAKKIWITEYGAPTPTNSSAEAEQTTELTEAISLVKQTSWIGTFYIYTWADSSVDDNFGLLTTNFVQKPAFDAVAAALRS